MRSAFGQMRSAIGQTLAHLAKRARNSPNVAHLVKCRTFDQLDKCAAHLAKCADWSNAPYNNTIVDTLVHSLYFVLQEDIDDSEFSVSIAKKLKQDIFDKFIIFPCEAVVRVTAKGIGSQTHRAAQGHRARVDGVVLLLTGTVGGDMSANNRASNVIAWPCEMKCFSLKI